MFSDNNYWRWLRKGRRRGLIVGRPRAMAMIVTSFLIIVAAFAIGSTAMIVDRAWTFSSYIDEKPISQPISGIHIDRTTPMSIGKSFALRAVDNLHESY